MRQETADRSERSGPRDTRAGAGDAGSVSRDRPARAVARDGAHHRRVRDRQGARRECAASPQPARRTPVHRDQHRGDSPRAARIGAVRPRTRRFHRRADACGAGASSRRKAGRSSSTRSATCRRSCRPGCCACCPTANFYRVGGHQPIKANVRVIAATHQDLEARVRQGLFREDLFHRLNVIRLRLPSLRERREDIPLLARHFLQKSARDLGVESKRLSEATLKYLQAQDWPGNVRQLENVCHWLTVMAPAVNVEVKDLPPELRAESAAPGSAELDCGARAGSGVAPESRRNGDHRTSSRASSRRRSSCARSLTPAGGGSRRRICSASAATRSRARSRN